MLKADNTRYADADFIALTNNGLLYLFLSLKLTLARKTVEHVNYPGQDTSLLALARYSSTYYKGYGLVGFQISTLIQLLIILDFIHGRDT